MDRGVAAQSHVLGLAIAVIVGAATTGLVLSAVAGVAPPQHPVSMSATATADGDITLVHRGGDSIDVRTLHLDITIGGHSLTHQPPIPFFAATGFHGGPTGPFNSAADPHWTVGETAGVSIADTNTPHPRVGQRVVVRLYRSGTVVGVAHTTVTADSEPE